MKNPQQQVGWGVSLLVVALLLTPAAVQQVAANFHVVSTQARGLANLNVLPSNNFQCGGIQQPMVLGAIYPSCQGGDINIPNGQCGWSGVKLRPKCTGNYFGQVIGGSGELQGDCYWNDGGETVNFSCGNIRVYDRLVCYTAMCGNSLPTMDQ